MGLLSSAEVIECSASDLVGQYVGQTGPKTKKLFDKALGKVLFVDEAYRLSEGHFAQEAIDEVVGLLTQPTYKAKLVVVLAGYEQDMNRLMSVNTGLASRFPHQVVFQNMTAEDCLKVIEKELKKSSVVVEGWGEESSDFMVEMKELLRNLAELPDWGNARDMVTLSKEISNRALLEGSDNRENLKLSAAEALNVVKEMVEGRKKRAKIPRKHRHVVDLPKQTFVPDPVPPPSIGTGTSQATTKEPTPPSPAVPQQHADPRVGRGSDRRRGTGPRGGNQKKVQLQSDLRAGRGSDRRRGREGTALRGGNQDRGRGGSIPHGDHQNRREGGSAVRGGHQGRGLGGNAARGSLKDYGQRKDQQADSLEAQGQRQNQEVHSVGPDLGVSDAAWFKLMGVKRAAEAAEERAREEIKAMQGRLEEQRMEEEKERRKLEELERAAAEAREAAMKAEIERQREEARKRAQAAFEAKKRAEAELRAKQEEERRRKKEEEQIQHQLRAVGNCVQGYQWLNMGSYYQCAGGAHTVSRSQLGL